MFFIHTANARKRKSNPAQPAQRAAVLVKGGEADGRKSPRSLRLNGPDPTKPGRAAPLSAGLSGRSMPAARRVVPQRFAPLSLFGDRGAFLFPRHRKGDRMKEELYWLEPPRPGGAGQAAPAPCRRLLGRNRTGGAGPGRRRISGGSGGGRTGGCPAYPGFPVRRGLAGRRQNPQAVCVDLFDHPAGGLIRP